MYDSFWKKSPLILISATAVNVTFVKKHPEASSLLSLLLLLLWLSSSSSLLFYYCYYHHHHCYYYYHYHYYYHSMNNIPYQWDINCAGHFTLDALASRPVACWPAHRASLLFCNFLTCWHPSHITISFLLSFYFLFMHNHRHFLPDVF